MADALTEMQVVVFYRLIKSGPTRIEALARELVETKASTTKVLDKLASNLRFMDGVRVINNTAYLQREDGSLIKEPVQQS